MVPAVPGLCFILISFGLPGLKCRWKQLNSASVDVFPASNVCSDHAFGVVLLLWHPIFSPDDYLGLGPRLPIWMPLDVSRIRDFLPRLNRSSCSSEAGPRFKTKLRMSNDFCQPSRESARRNQRPRSTLQSNINPINCTQKLPKRVRTNMSGTKRPNIKMTRRKWPCTWP
jgi:hypothetical protein